ISHKCKRDLIFQPSVRNKSPYFPKSPYLLTIQCTLPNTCVTLMTTILSDAVTIVVQAGTQQETIYCVHNHIIHKSRRIDRRTKEEYAGLESYLLSLRAVLAPYPAETGSPIWYCLFHLFAFRSLYLISSSNHQTETRLRYRDR